MPQVRLVDVVGPPSLFERWVDGRPLPSPGTNNGAEPIAFQSWHRFKEAFAPELVHRAVQASSAPVRSCLDPFGGSGTTALTAQFLGIGSTTVEVNPFLADVIRAKLAHYRADELASAIVDLRERVRTTDPIAPSHWAQLPATFIEPGFHNRWLFGQEVATQLAKLIGAINAIDDEDIQRLFRVLLGGMLVDVSNVVISGKGRRYRRNWMNRRFSAQMVDDLFFERCLKALADIHEFASRLDVSPVVVTGDSRNTQFGGPHDLVVSSPPYPNSFDYTDVYNVELWMLGYLATSADNAELRHATLSSHVQLQREYQRPPDGSPVLAMVMEQLLAAKSSLWSQWIPPMVGAYFADLVTVLTRIAPQLRPQATAWLVVGDSRYAGVDVPTATILGELAAVHGWPVRMLSPFRAMKSSAQQGHRQIDETLVVLQLT